MTKIIDHKPIIDAYLGGGTIMSVAQDFGLSFSGALKILKRNKIPRRQSGVRKGSVPRDKVRDADIAARRGNKETYKSIGDIYGITRERVRQILHEIDRQDLCFRRKTEWIEKECEICGTVFSGLPSKVKNLKTCSPDCAHQILANRFRDNILGRGKPIVNERLAGKTWHEIGRARGLSKNNISQLFRDAHYVVDRGDYTPGQVGIIFPGFGSTAATALKSTRN